MSVMSIMSVFSGKTAEELEAHIEHCNQDFGGYMKVNLDRGHGARGNGEGIWSVCASEEDLARYNNEKSRGETIKVFLCNPPIADWHGRGWGCPVVARTNGAGRPVAFEVDQKQLDAEVAHIQAIREAASNEDKD